MTLDTNCSFCWKGRFCGPGGRNYIQFSGSTSRDSGQIKEHIFRTHIRLAQSTCARKVEEKIDGHRTQEVEQAEEDGEVDDAVNDASRLAYNEIQDVRIKGKFSFYILHLRSSVPQIQICNAFTLTNFYNMDIFSLDYENSV